MTQAKTQAPPPYGTSNFEKLGVERICSKSTVATGCHFFARFHEQRTSDVRRRPFYCEAGDIDKLVSVSNGEYVNRNFVKCALCRPNGLLLE